MAEALCRVVENMQRALKVSKKCSKETLKKIRAIEENYHKMFNSYIALKNKKDGLQKEMKELQRI